MPSFEKLRGNHLCVGWLGWGGVGLIGKQTRSFFSGVLELARAEKNENGIEIASNHAIRDAGSAGHLSHRHDSATSGLYICDVSSCCQGRIRAIM
jgi:hypothetical protein